MCAALARLMGDRGAGVFGGFGTVAVLAAVFLVTTVLSQFASNTRRR